MYFDSTPMGLRQMRMDAKIKRVYAEASQDIQAKIDKYNKRYKALDADWQQRVKEGKATKAEYDNWKAGQVFIGKRWESVRDDILHQIHSSNDTSSRIINGEKRAVFIDTVNHAEYSIDKDFDFGLSFNLYDSATLTRILRDDPQILPEVSTDPNRDYAWGRKQITSAITQGIIQGESIPEIGKRIGDKLGSSNQKHMQRLARTAMTSAQNAGRIEAMHNAEEMGIKVQKEWIATLDNKTRDSHQHLDGQVQDVDKPFLSVLGDIMYPGDPDADPANVWCCRCSLGYEYPDYKNQYDQRRARNEEGQNELIDDMTYDQWKASKSGNKQPVTQTATTQATSKPNYYMETYKDDQYDESYRQDKVRYDEVSTELNELLRQMNSSEYREIAKEQEKISRYYTYLNKDISAYDGVKSQEDIRKFINDTWSKVDELQKQIKEAENAWRNYNGPDAFRKEQLHQAYWDLKTENYKKIQDLKDLNDELTKLGFEGVQSIRELQAMGKEGVDKRFEELYNTSSDMSNKQNNLRKEKEEIRKRLDTVYGIESAADAAKVKGIEFVPIQKVDGTFDSKDAISKLCGGDLTNGSCASLAFAYVGRKAGLDILDFRGGKSQSLFATNCDDILQSMETNSGYVTKGEALTHISAGKRALKNVEEGKEYYFACARHAAIVRRNNGKLEFLELQSAYRNGWRDFEEFGSIDKTLGERFGANINGLRGIEKTAYLADADEMAKDERFHKILGYINTKSDAQQKGKAGRER